MNASIQMRHEERSIITSWPGALFQNQISDTYDAGQQLRIVGEKQAGKLKASLRTAYTTAAR